MPPAWLPAAAADVWKTTVERLISQRTWLPTYEPMVAMFCCLYAEFIANPAGVQVTRVTQLRLLAGDLGFSPAHLDRVRRE